MSFALAPCKQNMENEMESSAWNRKLSGIPAITHADIAHTYGKYTDTIKHCTQEMSVNSWIDMQTKSKVGKTSTLASGLDSSVVH